MNKQIKRSLITSWQSNSGKLGFVALLMASSTAAAQDTEQLEPDLELLEFLGSFETDDGEWIPPEEFLTEDIQELLNLAARMDEISENPGSDDESQQNQESANRALQDN